MNEDATTDSSATESDTTGLPWPKSWRGAYSIVLAFFALWVTLLIALGELFK